MPIRIYAAPIIGTGGGPHTQVSDVTGPYRSLLSNYVVTDRGDGNVGDSYDEIHNRSWSISMATVRTEHDSVLDAIDADSRILPITPLRATSQTHLRAILNVKFSVYPVAWRQAALAYLEGKSIPCDWITTEHNLRDVLRFIIKLFSVGQIAGGDSNNNVIQFLRQNLDATVSSIPAAYRTALASWLNSKGISTSWITGSTTIRSVLKSLHSQVDFMYGRRAVHYFAGEKFI